MATPLEPLAQVVDEKSPSDKNETLPTTTTPVHDSRSASPTQQHDQKSKLLSVILWMPRWCRYDSSDPPKFTLWHNLLYAAAAGFTAANMFYNLPILDVIARDFNTTQAGVANIPSLAQAGYATGLLFVLPLGDMLPRRRFTLVLMLLMIVTWLGLCLTTDLTAFIVLSYFSAIFSNAPQIMIPLVTELSTDENRAFNMSILVSGGSLGIMVARILSGIVTQFTSWRNIYWLALGISSVIWISLWLFMPDYPATNPKTFKQIAKSYPSTLLSILTLYTKYPVLVQSCLLTFCTAVALTQYWTTLTFLLAGPPYYYSTIVIGLFGLVGLATMCLSPVYGKYIIQPLKIPLYSVLVGKTISLVGTIIGTFVGTHSVVGPIIEGTLLDSGLIIVQISNRMAIASIEPHNRNKVNTAFVSILYLGQVTGTEAGNQIYEKYGGWVASSGLSIAMLAFSYVIVALRGPHETGWIGWRGGWGANPRQSLDEEKSIPTETSD